MTTIQFPYLDFFQMVHSMASFYKASESQKAFQCMFDSAYDMIPNSDSHKLILRDALNTYDVNHFLKDSSTLLRWSYTINSFIHERLYSNSYFSFEKFKEKYNHDNMTITTWSHPTWKMIHYYASRYDGSSKYALAYKAFVSCLQFLLPCAKCKSHLKQNLADHPIDQFFSSPEDLFIWSYILHQTVSAQLGKPGISIEEARRQYGVR